MRQRDDRVYLAFMLDCIAKAGDFVSGVDASAFRGSELTQSAVAHQVHVLAHIAGLVSQPLRDACPEVPWSSIAAMGTRIEHDYTKVNPEVACMVVREELPVLRDQLTHILMSLEPYPNAT